jgi:release factor glutamine methyltransferase
MTPFAGVVVREALDSALVALEGARVDSPRLDAEVLLAHALGVDRTALWLDPDREVSGKGARWFRDAIRQRTVQRVPVAYLVGR